MPTILPPWLPGFFVAWRLFLKALGDKSLDPYVIWGIYTQLRTLGEEERAPSVLTFSAELNEPYRPDLHTFEPLASLDAAGAPPPAHVPSAYAHGSPWDHPKASTPTFVTFRLDVHGRSWKDILAGVHALIQLGYVKRLQIGQQRGVDNRDPGQRVNPAPPLPGWAHGAQVLIGVLDDTCPFAHRALRRADDPLATRVVSLWDQTTLNQGLTVAPPPKGFPYGRHRTDRELDERMRAHVHAQEVDEEGVYASAGIDGLPLMRRVSHAAAVTCLLAGAGRAAPRLPQPVNEGDDGHPFGDIGNDAAASAPLAVVQLPREQTAVRAGRWLAVNALDGLHHLIGVARRLGEESGKAPPRLVVNMSYGAMAGPHDGSGMLESAIDELCRASNGGLAVVVAAGNSHGTRRHAENDLGYTPGGLHAVQALEPGGSARFTLFIPPDKQSETYLEFWFSEQGKPPGQCPDEFLDADVDGQGGEVEIVVEPPVGDPWPAVVCPGLHVAPEDVAPTEGGLFFIRKPVQGRHRSMALLVVAATQVSGKYVSAPSGRWCITLRHKKAAADAAARRWSVDAWVERDDTDVGAVRPQSARLVDNIDGTPGGLTDGNTFSSLATGLETFKAGALMDRGRGRASERFSAYSAAGASDALGPEYSALADAHAALPGIRVSGAQSGMVVRANGTSMAAPQAARHLVEELVKGRTLQQERAKLSSTGRGNARLGRETV